MEEPGGVSSPAHPGQQGRGGQAGGADWQKQDMDTEEGGLGGAHVHDAVGDDYQRQQQQQQPQRPFDPDVPRGQVQHPQHEYDADTPAAGEPHGGGVVAHPSPPGSGGLPPPEQQQQPPANPALAAFEARLSAPDAAMEPGVLLEIGRYLQAGGPPAHLVGMLSNNYHGYAQMASLVCSWLDITEPPPDGSASASTSAEAAVAGGQAPDEATFLRAYVKDKFDPEAFQHVFSKGPPAWLKEIITSAPGRQLLYALSSQHRNCLLLNFAIQLVLARGHEDEVASVGSSLAGYFGVFLRLLNNRLRDMATARDERTLQRLAGELKESVCHSMHTYALAQMMLTELSRQPHGARFRRLSQELASHAAAQQGPCVWAMHRSFMGASVARPQDNEAARLVAAVLARGSLAGGGEVGRLAVLYALPDPPALALLRQPWLLDALTAALFAPGGRARAAPADERSSYIQLLAMATSAVDERRLGGGEDNDGGGGAGERAGEDGALAGGGGGGGGLDLTDVAPCSAAVRQAVEFAHNASAGAKIRPDEQRGAEEALRTPCAAMGLLHCMQAQMAGEDFWRESYNLGAVPLFCGLLAAIVPLHPLLHDKIVVLVSRVLHVMGNSKPDLARGLLDVAILLLRHGRSAGVLRFVEEWAAGADPSLVRYFIFSLLALAAPPYAPHFAACLIRLMAATGVRRNRMAASGGRDGDAGRLAQLEEFALACNDVNFQPPLSARERTFLQELQTERLAYL